MILKPAALSDADFNLRDSYVFVQKLQETKHCNFMYKVFTKAAKIAADMKINFFL